MKLELINRIITSLVLVTILIYSTYYSGLYFIFFLSLIYLLSFYEIIKNTKNLLFILSSNIIIIFALVSFYFLRGNTYFALVTLYWILLATFLSDIGGYIFGKIFKGKKLTKISPNKSYSGAIGSVVFSLVSLPLLDSLQFFFLNEKLVYLSQLKYFFITIFISIICQLGDLYVSFWKRKIKIKNISKVLPGHGGVLDRIDGLIFVLIFSFLVSWLDLI